MGEKILVVDDDCEASELLAFNLANEGFEVQCVSSAKEALKQLSPEHAIILLDVMMEGLSGYKMAEAVRRNQNDIPIIFLTAKDKENDMLTGFSVGGDDYIAKPFSVKEVIARVRAVLKRRPTNKSSEKRRLEYKNIVVDFDKKEFILSGKEVILTKTEFELLTMLLKNPDKIFSREALIKRLWSKTPYVTERTVDVHITRLRKKLGAHASMIVNRAGYGYKFILPDDA
ncbi:MAG: response regulator transcription factor [Tannerellaceae bacterium]|jgi:DNA-binding response OmpR family regulator|nr:response regulator transcription factor [Tannerellaceae bacterium]